MQHNPAYQVELLLLMEALIFLNQLDGRKISGAVGRSTSREEKLVLCGTVVCQINLYFPASFEHLVKNYRSLRQSVFIFLAIY